MSLDDGEIEALCAAFLSRDREYTKQAQQSSDSREILKLTAMGSTYAECAGQLRLAATIAAEHAERAEAWSAAGPTQHRVAAAFGAVLRTARTGAGISQEALAARAGIDRTMASAYERGVKAPNLRRVIVIADALGIEASTLVTMTVARMRRRTDGE